MYCDEQDKSIFKLQEVYKAIRIVTAETFTAMFGNFGIKTMDVETVDTVNAAGVGNSIYCFHFWWPAKPAVLNSPLHPWWWFVGDIMFDKPHPTVPMTAYK